MNLDKKISVKWFLIFGLMVFVFFLSFNLFKTDDALAGEIIAKIKAANNLDDQVRLYKNLMEKIGPEEAQEELFRSGLPFTGQTHLVNHASGEYLYKKYGPAGLAKCREYFLASCNHGFVISAIAKGGMPEVAKTMQECQKAGPAVFSQCAHAVGHGFLASEGYKELLKSLELCDQVEFSSGQFPKFNCYDGVFMENIWGVHDGQPSPDRWVKESDPVYPCNDKRIDPKYILACWSNQPALAYQLFKGDIKKVGQLCDRVKENENKEMCFNGLARQIHPITAGDVDAVFGICSLLPGEWNNYCVVINANAYFSVGDREIPFAICDRIQETAKDQCYNKLVVTIKYQKKKEIPDLCGKIKEETWREKCLGN